MKKTDLNLNLPEQTASTLGSESSDDAVYDTSNDISYEDIEGIIEPSVHPFTKQAVLSIEAHDHNSLLTKSLRNTITTAQANSPATKLLTSISENCHEDPLAFLNLREADQIQGENELRADQPSRAQAHLKRTQTKQEIRIPSLSYLQAITELFAGHRKPLHNRHVGKQRSAEPNLNERLQESASEDNSEATNDDSLQVSTKSRLALSQVIPGVHPLHAEILTQRPGYREIRSSALENRYTGYAVVTRDTFTPQKVQRGFDINIEATMNGPAACPPTPALAPLDYRAYRQGNSAAKLLDRDGGAWAHWLGKNPSPEKMSFAKQSLDQAGLNEVQPTKEILSSGFLKDDGNGNLCTEGSHKELVIQGRSKVTDR